MTMVPPVLGPYPPSYLPYTNITPFTYRDGLTYLEQLESFQAYINNYVIPFINDTYNTLGPEFQAQIDALTADVNAQFAAIASDFNTKQTAQDAATDKKIADLTKFVNDSIASIINNTIAVTDPVIYGVLNNPASQSRGLTDTLYAKPRTGKNGLTGWYHVDGYGADLTGVTDAGPAINNAITDAKVKGGTVYCPAGTLKVLTCINLSNIHPMSYNYNTGVGVSLKGAGKHQTILTGGEAAFGFMELVGSNRITVEGFSMVSTGTIQFGILAGRTTGDGSSGEHIFKDLLIYGAFTLAGIFAMSSEINLYDHCTVYTTVGKGIMLARENTYSAAAKYTPLSATAVIAGGNGENRMISCQILTISPNPTDYALVLEYVQTFLADNLYLFTTNQTAQIFMGKLCFGATFKSMQQEYQSAIPLGFYFSAAGAGQSSPDYRGVSVTASRICSIYAEDLVRLAELEINGTEWRGATPWQIDVYTLFDSKVNYDTRNTSNSTRVTNPQYRVRSLSRSNDWGPVDTAPLNTPVLTLGATGTTGGLFAAGTYYWVLTATNQYGQTIASNELSATLVANGTQILNWATPTGATGFKLYRATAAGGPYQRVALMGIVNTYSDLGNATQAEAPPTVATAGRPSAAYRGVAARMFDTSLGKPIWSDGTNWKDATGVVV